VSDLVLVANGTRVPLSAHTRTSRTALRRSDGLWHAADLTALTHFAAAVDLPADRGVLLSVHGRRGSEVVVVSQIWHVPASATIALAKAAHRLTGSVADVVSASHRLHRLRIPRHRVHLPSEVALLDMVGGTDQTAIALTMSHPNISTIAPTEAAATKSLLAQTPEVQTLGTHIAQMQRAGKDFATLETAVDPDGSPSKIVVGQTTTTFQTFRLDQQDAGLTRTLRSALAAGVTGVRDTAQLGAVIDKPLDQDRLAATKTWVQPEGVVPRATTFKQGRKRAGVDIKVKNPGLNFGTYVVVNGSYANGKVPLKLYNNYVRWVSVYVQYLGKDGENLSVDPSPGGNDTKYAQYLGLLPQVFTVLGIPLWDTNTIEVSLEFPPGSHVARLLLCGLGSDIEGGGWRQYFPPDAYPDRIAPTDEVLVPGLLTGILTIGLSAFALATDFNVALAWPKVRADVEAALKEGFLKRILSSLLRSSALPFVSAEVAAVENSAGDADVAADLGNVLPRVLKGLGSAIPKVLFSPASGAFFAKIAGEITALEAAEKVVEAIPIIGQVLAVIAVLGDVATLAEVCAETIVSPWVIENEVTLTYNAQVTVSRDPRSSTFPATARSWRLEALVDGALSLEPITGSINDGGKTRSEPLKVPVVAPFGGKEIQWSFVALDGSGRQVGTGVSAKFTNDDPAKPAKDVSITITQLPATITASTVFKRAGTTAYDTAAGGYTWSEQVKVTGTVHSKDIQEITGTAVATLAGVAGMVFKQEDRYYIRGVPLAQDGATIKLGSAPKEGYARRPFLLLDPFVDKGDRGNNVLLEPDETSHAYHVRRVSLDHVTGELSWDADVSHGTFLLPVSAAALHSSGRVVALNTDSGRLGWLRPVRTSRPQLAAYTAGPGTRVGLLSSPIAVAVTNPGVVLVLEAGTAQLAAFDLNGNPIRYFPAKSLGGDRQFTLGLASAGTPLDLAVDGADQIYVLYFAGTGADPADYHVDVYTRSGEVLDTKSPGVNVPHFAVDYWRSIYGANYEALSDLGAATPRIDHRLGVAEPSLSRFDPTESTEVATRLARRVAARRGRRRARVRRR
jgi:hypothetical protein